MSRSPNAARWVTALMFSSSSLLLACGESPNEAQACFSSCDRQREFCADLDVVGCYELCRFAVAKSKDDAGCRERFLAVWNCDVTATWECAAGTDVVAQPAEPDACEPQRQAAERADCFGE